MLFHWYIHASIRKISAPGLVAGWSPPSVIAGGVAAGAVAGAAMIAALVAEAAVAAVGEEVVASAYLKKAKVIPQHLCLHQGLILHHT